MLPKIILIFLLLFANYEWIEPTTFDHAIEADHSNLTLSSIHGFNNNLNNNQKLILQNRPNIPFDPNTLISYVHGSGIAGYISITPLSSTTNTTINNSGSTIKIRLDGGPYHEQYALKLYSYPIILGTPCNPSTLGSLIYDFSYDHGTFTVGVNYTITSKLTNLGALIGRSIVFSGIQTGISTCSIILTNGNNTIYEGKFHAPIAGQVYLISTSLGTALSTFWMMYSDGQRKDGHHKWTLFEATEHHSTPESMVNNQLTKCNSLIGAKLFDSQIQGGQLITVSTERPNTKGKSHQILRFISSLNKSPSLYLSLFDETNDNEIISCTPLILIKSKTALAKFNSQSITGQIKFEQKSPFEATKVDISLDLRSSAFSYGIDVLPSIRRRKIESKKCPNVRETIYNPFHIDPEQVPHQGEGTADQYATGDLSGKFGTLASKNNAKISTWDYNLPLFGYFSIIGRAVVIYAPDGPPLGCANLDLDEIMTTAYATFDVPLQGQFIMRQPVDECFTDTYIYIEISRPENKKANKTLNHPWHIHNYPIDSDIDSLSTNDCQSTGGHLNPFNVSTDCIYQRDCSIFTPTRCELGDESSKLGPIDVPIYKPLPNGEADVGKYYLIDSDLSLCGPNSIVGKSIVIDQSNFGSKRLTCSNILEFKSKQ